MRVRAWRWVQKKQGMQTQLAKATCRPDIRHLGMRNKAIHDNDMIFADNSKARL